jgi:hypothetical protein
VRKGIPKGIGRILATTTTGWDRSSVASPSGMAPPPLRNLAHPQGPVPVLPPPRALAVDPAPPRLPGRGLAAVGPEGGEAGDDFEIWEDAEPGESTVDIRWLRDREALDDDDLTLDGEMLFWGQRQEVRKESYLGLPRATTRPSGQHAGQALEPLVKLHRPRAWPAASR